MNPSHAFRSFVLSAAFCLAAASAFAQGAQAPAKPFEPVSGQPGKDVVWVPTPQALVEKMLDLAKLTPQDFHMDLGSGDGRTVITAAKRGARSEGIEYNPDMVALSERNAKAAGVTERATFRKADLFETDFSKAQVITLFLLPTINKKLRPQILNMKPGTRIVSNTFTMGDWTAGPVRDDRRRLRQLVHRASVARAGESGRHLGGAGTRRADAVSDIPDGFRLARIGPGEPGPAARRRDHVHRRRVDLHRSRGRQHDPRHRERHGVHRHEEVEKRRNETWSDFTYSEKSDQVSYFDGQEPGSSRQDWTSIVTWL